MAYNNIKDLQCLAGTGLTVNYNAGVVQTGLVTYTVAAGTATITNATNYIFVNASGVVTVNTTGFPTTGGITTMAVVVASSGVITSITDKRAWLVSSPTTSALTSGFRAAVTTGTNFGGNSMQKLTFGTSIYDNLTEYSTSTGRFTATATGTYLFNVYINGNGPNALTSSAYATLYVNGTQVEVLGYQNTSGGSFNGAGILKLNATDYVEVYVFCPGTPQGVAGNAAATAGSTWWAGARIQ